jgi:hypothetical protein
VGRAHFAALPAKNGFPPRNPFFGCAVMVKALILRNF